MEEGVCTERKPLAEKDKRLSGNGGQLETDSQQESEGLELLCDILSSHFCLAESLESDC